MLACSMNLLMVPSWHEQIPGVPQAGEIIPWNLLQAKDAAIDETLSKAKRFAGR